jgi:hypothetical protein
METATNSVYPPDIHDRESFGPSERVALSGLVLADHLEKKLAHYYMRGASTRSLLLDFAEAEFIDTCCARELPSDGGRANRKTSDHENRPTKGKTVLDFLKQVAEKLDL